MTGIQKSYGLGLLIGFALVGTVTTVWLGAEAWKNRAAVSVARCTDPVALAVIAEVRKPGWAVEKITATRAGGLSIWHANGVEGLGVASDGNEALPDDGPRFSHQCRVAIFSEVQTNLLDPWEARQRAQVMKVAAP